MNRTQHDALRATPQQLRQLFRIAEDETEWKPDELRSILEHQLEAPLRHDLGKTGPSSAAASSPQTFGELLASQCPDVPLLMRVKEFAKLHYIHPKSALPPDVGRVLYYASILAALLRGGSRISSLNDDELLAGARWASRQPWLIEPCLTLFWQAMVILPH